MPILTHPYPSPCGVCVSHLFPCADELDTYKLTQGRCDMGYYEFKGLCWFFESDATPSTYDSAQASCVAKGGNLATIRDAYDSSYVVRYRAAKFPAVPRKYVREILARAAFCVVASNC